MQVKFIKDDDYVNYKKCAMFIGTPSCTWKCCKETGIPCSVCQNYPWSQEVVREISDEEIIKKYMADPLEESIVFGGLEPMDTFNDLITFVNKFRAESNDDIVIYTGYYYEEIAEKIAALKNYKNIIIKYGRYIPNHQTHYDEVLGIYLASDNQYAERIS